MAAELAQIMMKPSALRDRITELCYLSDNEGDATQVIERAFSCATQCESAASKLQQALREHKIPHEDTFHEQLQAAFANGVLDDDEVTLMEAYHALQTVAIRVDSHTDI